MTDRADLPGVERSRARRRRSTTVALATAAVSLLAGACASSNNSTGASNSASGARGTGAPFGLAAGQAGWDCGSACTWNGDQTDAAVIEAAVGGGGRQRAVESSPGKTADASFASRPLSVDDNDAFSAYLGYRTTFERGGLPFVAVPVEGRRIIKVVDGAGRPVRGAMVVVNDNVGGVVARLMTYGDGRAVFDAAAALTPAGTPYTATVTKGLATATAALAGGTGPDVITLDVGAAAPALSTPVKVDVVFVLDTSGSMRDELAALQQHASDLATRLAASPVPIELRLGLTVYRDRGDLYDSRTFALTAEPSAFADALAQVRADGGGDTHEDLQAGLRDALVKPGWGGDDTVKVLVLVGDAPPHLDYPDEAGATYADSGKLAAQLGIKVSTVGAVGLDRQGEYIFRQLAQMTLGRYVALAPGTSSPVGAGTADKSAYGTLPLDEVLVRLVLDDLATVAS